MDGLVSGADSARGLSVAVAYLAACAPAPNVALVTGDLVHDGPAEAYRRPADLLGGLPCPWHVIPGNHDDRASLRAALPEHAYLGSSGPCHYAVGDTGPLRLVGLDTRNGGGWLGPAQLSWLDARLAERARRPTVVFLHHHPVPSGIAEIDRMGLLEADGSGGWT